MRQTFVFALVAVTTLGSPSPAEAIVKGEPTEPSDQIANQLNTLVDRFKSDNSGYGCYPVDGGTEREDMNCFLALRCSLGIVGFRKNEAQELGINFGGDHFLSDPGCLTKYFFSQIESLLEILGKIGTARAREIIDTMDKNPKAYGSCHPEKIGKFPEGLGAVTYAQDDKHYGPNFTEGRRILKIFCWQVKQQ